MQLLYGIDGDSFTATFLKKDTEMSFRKANCKIRKLAREKYVLQYVMVVKEKKIYFLLKRLVVNATNYPLTLIDNAFMNAIVF